MSSRRKSSTRHLTGAAEDDFAGRLRGDEEARNLEVDGPCFSSPTAARGPGDCAGDERAVAVGPFDEHLEGVRLLLDPHGPRGSERKAIARVGPFFGRLF